MRVERLVLCCALVFGLVGIWWGLPASESWAPDAITPRSVGLLAIAETYRAGHHHIYPPLHMLLLTVLSTPVYLWGFARVGFDADAFSGWMIQPGPMTVIEVIGRAVALVMMLGVVRNMMAIFRDPSRPVVGPYAGLAVATIAPLVYYAKTGNLDVPSLFWASLTLRELGRVLAGEPRESRAIFAAAAAVMTKDQAAGLVLVPLVVVAVARARAGKLRCKPVARGAASATLLVLLLSGAVVNPSGYVARLRDLFGPASREWEGYARTAEGTRNLVHDALVAFVEQSSWQLAVLAVFGAALVVRQRDLARALPAIAAVAFTLSFTLGARRTEARFILPQSVMLMPYAGVALGAVQARLAATASRLWRPGVLALVVYVPSLLGVVSMDATLLADSRYTVEKWIAQQRPDAHIEVMGGPKFLPRIAAGRPLVRPGAEPIDSRTRVPGLVEVEDLSMSLGERKPDAVIVSAEFAHPWPEAVANGRVTAAPSQHATPGAYGDPASERLFAQLEHGQLPYRLLMRADCRLPWPLTCRRVHGTTGEPMLVYQRVDAQ